jgi:hypothetical protein
MSISIGAAAIDRAAYASANSTLLDLANPASESGTVSTVEIWSRTNLSGCKVGIFYLVVQLINAVLLFLLEMLLLAQNSLLLFPLLLLLEILLVFILQVGHLNVLIRVELRHIMMGIPV